MLFVELRFFLFFAVVFGVHWALRGARARKLCLLGASYLFYGAWDWRFLSLILISTAVDYLAGRRMSCAIPDAARKRWLIASLVTNLGLLGVFKYFNFFAASFVDFAALLGFQVTHSTVHIVLPVGISFFTFQTMSYSIDVFHRKLDARKSVLDLALFVAFFPQLVAGPIVRARDFLPQLDRLRPLDKATVRPALVLFLVGFVKKACVSDNLAPFVDRYFDSPLAFDAASSWVAVLFYTVQIYCDFSGYSDMAIACAALLGYRLCDNFNAPYFAANITDFWRRWHMSLSSWLRDYLYIPLGGSRGLTKWFHYRNLMLTMLLGGLWHGASWNFVVWGGMHGLALVLHKEWSRLRPARSQLESGHSPSPLGYALSMALTFYWVMVAWIFFRAAGFEDAWTTVRAFVLFQGSGTSSLPLAGFTAFAALALLHAASYRRWFSRLWKHANTPMFAAFYGAAFAFAVACVPRDYRPFIYFQF